MSEASSWASALMDGLVSAGIRDVVVSPGSRSTPLVFAADAQESLRLHSVIDERAAGFFALGQARVTGRPTVLICTSGTAGAHYYPAVIEAAMAYVPMVVVTADRPPELQGCGAPQTIDQTRLYGGYVRAFHDLGLPNDTPVARAAVRRRAVQAVDRALGPAPGPVHINVPARKPLEPDASDKPAGVPSPQIIRPPSVLAPSALAPIADQLAAAQRPVITVGPAPLWQGCLREAIAELARRADAAVYAEATSQARFGIEQPGDALSVLLGAPPFANRFDPDLIVQLGPPVTSGSWHRWRATRPDVPHVAIGPYDWNDPSQRADFWIAADVADAVAALIDELSPVDGVGPWRRAVAGWDERAWASIDHVLPSESEGEVVRIIRSHLPADSVLMLGNSLPVRHFDAFCRSGGRTVGVLSQRGANGIDGLVAGAVGASSVGQRPVTLVLGDVSLSHDAGSLALAQRVSAPLVITVLDNGGGRIFDLLPAGRRFQHQPVYEHFATSPAIDAQTLAAAFGLCHVRVEGTSELEAALSSAYRLGAATVVQVKVPDHGARAVSDAVDAALEEDFGRRGL